MIGHTLKLFLKVSLLWIGFLNFRSISFAKISLNFFATFVHNFRPFLQNFFFLQKYNLYVEKWKDFDFNRSKIGRNFAKIINFRRKLRRKCIEIENFERKWTNFVHSFYEFRSTNISMETLIVNLFFRSWVSSLVRGRVYSFTLSSSP